jgi:type IV secretory pathway TrbD component
MDRLSIVLTFMTGSVLVGGLVIAVLSLGYYTWPAIVGAVVIGTVLTWPVAYVISRQIKRNDPSWNERRIAQVDGVIPERDAPEV